MNPLLSPNLKSLAVIGLWHIPNKSKFLNNLLRIYGILMYVWFTVFTGTQFAEMYFIGTDYKTLTSNAGVTLLYMVVVAKVYLMVFKKKQVEQLVEKINEIEMNIVNSQSISKKNILISYSARNWFTTRKFWALATFTISGFFISPRIESVLRGKIEVTDQYNITTLQYSKLLVFSSWLPYDKFADGYFEFTYALQTVSGTIGALYVGIWDTFIVALIIHAIGQFIVLQDSLRNLGKNGNDDDEFVYGETMDCIKHHNYIIQYVGELDQLISPIMFMEFFVCSLMLCAIGFQAILEGPSVRFAFTVEYLISMLIQLFMFYWHGNEMILESLKVSNAVWESSWYTFSYKTKKALCLILMRSQNPLTLSIGYFYTMSLETYLLILRASYSYLALLRQMYK